MMGRHYSFLFCYFVQFLISLISSVISGKILSGEKINIFRCQGVKTKVLFPVSRHQTPEEWGKVWVHARFRTKTTPAPAPDINNPIYMMHSTSLSFVSLLLGPIKKKITNCGALNAAFEALSHRCIKRRMMFICARLQSDTHK